MSFLRCTFLRGEFHQKRIATIVYNFHSQSKMLKNDLWIKENATNGMITPFIPELVRHDVINPEYDEAFEISGGTFRNVLSYGVSSYGYDIRLSPRDFRIFKHIPGTVINPKRFNPQNLEEAILQYDEDGEFFVLPGHSYGLGVAIEKLRVPSGITVICLGKSTYARLGIIANTTPAECEWEGHLTLEFSNASSADCRLYANEGICQLLFFEGEECETSYEGRNGKYQGQPELVTFAKV